MRINLRLASPYRFGIWEWWKHYLDPRTYFYAAKYLVQRAFRGWADCDIWSLDHYLNTWMPDALTHLKNRKHGCPMSCFPDPSGHDYSDEDYKIASAKWSAELDRIINGFKAGWRIDDSLYEEELGEYEQSEERFQKSEALNKRDGQLVKDGLAAFVEHYQSLWD